MVRRAQHDDGDDESVEIREESLPGGSTDAATGRDRGVWFTGLPRAGRWREILGRYEVVREHADDLMRIADFAECDGRICRLRVEIDDRRAGRVIVLCHRGAPFSVKALD